MQTRLSRHALRRMAVLALLVAAAIAIPAYDPLHDAFDEVLDFTRNYITHYPVLGMLVFVFLSALSAMLAFFSSAVVVPVAVYVWGKTTTMLLLLVGWLLGGAFAFTIGRWLGRPVVRWFAPEKKVDYYEKRLSQEARFPLVLLFQLALPSEIPGYVLGIIRYRFVLYLAALALAELPYAIGAVYLGSSFLEQNYLLLGAIAVVGIAVMTFFFRRLQKRIGRPPE